MTRSLPLRPIRLAAALPLLWLACGQGAPSVTPISADELVERIVVGHGEAPFVLDVRTPQEFSEGHLPGAVNIPHTELARRLGELPAARETEIVVHCKSGRRAEVAEEILVEAGYTRVRDLEGHFDAWLEAGHPTD